MNSNSQTPRWSLPYCTPIPSAPRLRRRAKAARIAAYVLLGVALIAPVVQFQVGTMRRIREAEEFTRLHPGRSLAGVKQHKGAIGRWRKAVRQFWGGWDIYQDPSKPSAPGENRASSPSPPKIEGGRAWLHPNMPFVVILLTPLAYLPVPVMALVFNLLKLAALLGAFWLAGRLASHEGRRIPDWVLGLGLVGVLPFIIGDIQHGNTNGFVLFAVVFHLWAYRRGWDVASGASLALAICLKMTPALFVVYWFYQRSWKLLVATVAGLVVFAVVIPCVAVGPARFADLTGSWLDDVILPGLVEGAWYPTHINQSLPGVFSRYFLGEPNPNGNVFWNPDDNPYAHQQQHRWIAFISLSDATVKWLIRVAQVVVVGLMGWAIGWRKLPRDDGRRMLHYGLVACGMMLLNQRTWDHHAGVLLLGSVAIWSAIGFGAFSRSLRILTMCLMLMSWVLIWITRSSACMLIAVISGAGSDVGEYWGDLMQAYAPVFYCFLLLLGAGVILSVAMRRLSPPYARVRQKLSA